MTTSDEPSVAPPPITAEAWEPFPEIDLRQMLRMTDDTGIFQHAVYGMPDPNHGYCIDDNARALIVALLYAQLRGYDERAVPLHRYLTFLAYAFNDDTRTFRNFMGYDRRWLEAEGSQDSQGRTIWTLGLTVRLAPQEGIRELAQTLLHKGLPAVEKFGFIRSWAFALIGLDEYLHAVPEDDHARHLRDTFAEKLYRAYADHAADDWPWWEDVVTYDNAKLVHALLVSGRAMGRPEMIDAGLRSLRWLIEVQTAENEHGPYLSIIGNDGWLRRDGHRARFDQQPLEAYAMVHACLAAAELTGDDAWAHHAWRCFEWFRGRNDLSIPLHNETTGGCQDGLRSDGVNKNQGAESILAYLLSVLELHRYRDERSRGVSVKSQARVGYAIIGVSGFAEFCLDQYGRIDGIEPVAVWNRTASKAERLADEQDLQAYGDLQDMLRDPRVQVVHVATTPGTHADFALQALAAGKHVLCEKPIATDVVDAQRMIQAAAERDRVLSVNFMMRHGPLAAPVRRLVESGVLGAPLRGNFVNRAGDKGLPPGHWFWDEQKSGGIFVEHAVHLFDLTRYWLPPGTPGAPGNPGTPGSASGGASAIISDIGDVEAASAQRFRRPGTDIIDQVSCEVRHGPQTTVNHYHGFLQPVPLDQQDFRLIFERGHLIADGWIAAELTLHAVLSDDEIEQVVDLLPDPKPEVQTLRRFEGDQRILQHRHRETTVDREVLIRWKDPDDKQTIYGKALQRLMEDMLATVRDRSHRPRVTAEDGLAALKLAKEATRLAKGGTP